MDLEKSMSFEGREKHLIAELESAGRQLVERWHSKPPTMALLSDEGFWSFDNLTRVAQSPRVSDREKFLYVAEGLLRGTGGHWALYPMLQDDRIIYVNMLIWCPNLGNVVNVNAAADYLHTEPMHTFVSRVMSGEDLTETTPGEIWRGDED
ncbi:hypothetical protein CFRA_02870 [Corynebacterium frankenforstense DSM 45800]|uniref:Uncharacterized protein n=1 Tax=Corynebacterium frankenforstense DSM 45800 TaxID=1437875 RepID=A0A1L7CRE7_9CORY|nr:hypothetical protein [Corynebacterium frankenforstense]APT88391.1 hypothetical protein CFRA_02870 [Corynebacterium frankenforstense DSM 45800]